MRMYLILIVVLAACDASGGGGGIGCDFELGDAAELGDAGELGDCYDNEVTAIACIAKANSDRNNYPIK